MFKSTWCLLAFTLLLSHSLMTSAHNVLGGVYVIGDTVEGELGFSNGDIAPHNSPVIVTNSLGEILFELETDADGFFSFEVNKKTDHFIRANLGLGHIYDAVIQATELPQGMGGEPAFGNRLSAAAVNQSIGSEAMGNDELQILIETAVARQIKPLRQELSAYKEKASFQDSLGGIGYILGLCGAGIWLNQRKKEKAKVASGRSRNQKVAA